MGLRIKSLVLMITCFSVISCQDGNPQRSGKTPSSLSEVPAARLNFRYEPDVPGPQDNNSKAEERNAGIQADFDQNRPQEVLDKTMSSPDKKHVLAVYHRGTDLSGDYRLDMYSPSGKLLKKVTADAMAVQYPDTIVWAPDSSAVAFAAKVREGQTEAEPTPPNPQIGTPEANSSEGSPSGPNSDNSNVEVDVNKALPAPTPTSPTGVLVFRTLQVYTCNAEGENTKALTQNEGLIYFYYVWSPDSSALAALAATGREWDLVARQADSKGEIFTPLGRLRVVERNGRERRLDDALTAVWPVWSPDSAKIAGAFDTQIRVYDATGNTPTQAAIPLRNQLLLSSQAYERDLQKKLDPNTNVNGDSSAATNVNSNANQTVTTTLPDDKSLVSFNPIIELNWTADNILYFRTAYLKRMKIEADSRTSFARWHRLIFSYQPAG